MSFTWHTQEQDKITMVECARQDDPAGFNGKQVIRTKGISYPYEIIDVDKPEGKKQKVMVHKATVSQLNPDTKYIYRVGDGKHWSEGSFTTALGQDNEGELKFLFIADTQESTRENYQSGSKIILNNAFEKNPDIRFVVQAGDFVNRGMNGQEWAWAFEAGEKYFRNMPLAAVVGNHETGGLTSTAPQQRNAAYLPFFNNPSNHTSVYAEGSAYSFNYGTVHLLCLDMQNLNDAIEINSKTGEKKYLQAATDWITKDLETATAQKKWKIVVMHQPIYGANRDEKEFREVLAPLFDKGKADVVITGHDHYYFRSFPMRYDAAKNDGEVVPMDQFGTVYLIGGTSCSKLYVQKFARPYQAVVMAKANFPGRYPYLRNEPLTKPDYSTFTVSKEKLHYQFFDIDGKLLDEFYINKKSEKNNN
jgi:predicted phosphodiesterase